MELLILAIIILVVGGSYYLLRKDDGDSEKFEGDATAHLGKDDTDDTDNEGSNELREV